MKERFLELCKNIGIIGDPSKAYDDLIALYSNPDRYYHNLNHIEHCLKEFDTCKHLLDNSTSVELALWYHDCEYVAGGTDNEIKSIGLLCIHLCELVKLNSFFETYIKSMAFISLTKEHQPHDPDSKYVLDIDLSILGSDSETFEIYNKNIRKEYGAFSDEEYNEGRKKVLLSFLNRDTIYLTDFFKEKYEAQARINLKKVLCII